MLGATLFAEMSAGTAAPQPIVPAFALDLPVPPSINKTRRIDWRSFPAYKKWQADADKHFLLVKSQLRGKKMPGRFELTIVIDETQTRCDAGNLEKHATDFLKRVDLITDDGPKYLRKLTIMFGAAPAGCRLILQECV